MMTFESNIQFLKFDIWILLSSSTTTLTILHAWDYPIYFMRILKFGYIFSKNGIAVSTNVEKYGTME